MSSPSLPPASDSPSDRGDDDGDGGDGDDGDIYIMVRCLSVTFLLISFSPFDDDDDIYIMPKLERPGAAPSPAAAG